MAVYVVSDLHGHKTELLALLKKINFDPAKDILIIAGDSIDRGPENLEMLRFIEDHPNNVIILMGNHEQMFSRYCSSLKKLAIKLGTENLLEIVNSPKFYDYLFDSYGTVEDLIRNNEDLTLADFERWHNLIEGLPRVEEVYIRERDHYYVCAHAGYCCLGMYKLYRRSGGVLSKNDYYLWARAEENLLYGGEPGNVTVVHGHTPTWCWLPEYPTAGMARVMSHETEDGRRFINVDCGIAYLAQNRNANLACLRLDDEKAFYLF